MGDYSIGNSLVDKVYDDLRARKHSGNSLDVIIDSGGGQIDSAYNLRPAVSSVWGRKSNFCYSALGEECSNSFDMCW